MKAIKDIKTADEARSVAIEWQATWDTEDYSYCELAEFQSYFTTLARRFKLTSEFRENGIL